MDKDRGAALTVQAYADGILPCSALDLHEEGWYKRFSILLRGLERKNGKEVALAGLQFASGLLANGTLTEDSFNKTQERARDLLYSVIGHVYPWEGASYEERINKEAADYKEQWKAATGEDPDSPEYKAKEARLTESLRRRRTEETDEQKQSRALRAEHLDRLQKKDELIQKRRQRNRRSVWKKR